MLDPGQQITFYGAFSGASSFPVVCRALAQWLMANGRSVWICDLQAPSYQRSVDLEQDLRGFSRVSDFTRAKIIERMKALQQGYTVPRDDVVTSGRGLLFGFPAWGWVVPTHNPFITYTVCDVDRVPDHWVASINEIASHVLTPSRWCASVLKHAGVKRRIQVVPHGIDPAVFCPDDPDGPARRGPCYTGSPWRSKERLPVLRYFCSSITGSRKSLHETIEAWRIVRARQSAPNAVLVVRGHGPSVVAACRDVPGLVLEQGEPMRPLAMARVLRATDLLLVPSRAEGFSILPLEALACGTPVAATDCTGHAEWFHTIPSGLRLVETGDFESCLPGDGCAPALDPVHLADVIEAAIRDLLPLHDEALQASPKVRQRWAWNAALTGSAFDKLTATG